MTESPRTTRRWTFVVILLVAFTGGLCATFATIGSQPEPYRGVYRQAAIGVIVDKSGKISSLEHAQGDLVRPGEPLATITTAVSEESLAEMAKTIEELRQSLDAARDDAAMELALQNERIEDDRLETRLRYADLLRSRLSVQTQKKALEQYASGQPNIVKTSVGAGTSPSPESGRTSLRLRMADALNHEEVLQTQIQLCEDRLTELDQLQSSLPEKVEGSCGVSRLEMELAELETKYESAKTTESKIEVASPAYGRIGVWRHEVGDYASTGQTLVEIFDAERPFVLLRVPVSELLELTVGRKVRVELQGIHTKKTLEGVVQEIRSEAERDADAATAPGATQALVHIAPTGRLWPSPPPGTTARIYPE